MRTLVTAYFVLFALCIANADTSVNLDDIFGPDDTPAIVPIPMDDEVPEWSLPPPLVLPPPLDPIQLRKLEDAIQAVFAGKSVLTPQGLVVLVPPLRGTPLESLASWLRIMKAAGCAELPTYAHGTPAWVRWRQLSTSPLISEADWIVFYGSI